MSDDVLILRSFHLRVIAGRKVIGGMVAVQVGNIPTLSFPLAWIRDCVYKAAA